MSVEGLRSPRRSRDKWLSLIPCSFAQARASPIFWRNASRSSCPEIFLRGMTDPYLTETSAPSRHRISPLARGAHEPS